VEAADHHRDAGLAQRPCDIERARKLVRLHADQAHHAEAIMLFDERDDIFDTDARVGLVHRGDVEGDVRSERLSLSGVACQRVYRGQRVRWNGGTRPLDDIAIGVVVRRLDQHDLKGAFLTRFRRKHGRCPRCHFRALLILPQLHRLAMGKAPC